MTTPQVPAYDADAVRESKRILIHLLRNKAIEIEPIMGVVFISGNQLRTILVALDGQEKEIERLRKIDELQGKYRDELSPVDEFIAKKEREPK